MRLFLFLLLFTFCSCSNISTHEQNSVDTKSFDTIQKASSNNVSLLVDTPKVLKAGKDYITIAPSPYDKLYFGDTGAGWIVMTLLLLLTVLSLVMDYLATVYGVKKMGATWRGAVGAVVGGLIGLFFHLPGIILGPFIGAFLFEKLAGRNWKEAGRAGIGAMIGLLAGALGKLACCVTMMGLFILSVLWYGATYQG